MKIVAIKEKVKGETRAAITPESAKMFVLKGYDVVVEKDIGVLIGYSDQDYINAGARVSAILLEILSDADIILKILPSPIEDEFNEINMSKEGAMVIGYLSEKYAPEDYLNRAQEKAYNHRYGCSSCKRTSHSV